MSWIGVDGGGSKTEACLLEDGGIARTCFGGASAVRPGQVGASAEVLISLMRELLSQSNLRRVSVLCVGVAGVGRDPERQELMMLLESADLADTVIVRTDAEIAHYAAFGQGAGILLIAGTGSVAFGRGGDAIDSTPLSRCGGWGPGIGDEGSGSWIGKRALGMVAAALDGRKYPRTALVSSILGELGLSRGEQLIPWAASATPGGLASLAQAVLALAAEGDPASVEICSAAAAELVSLVSALLARLCFAPGLVEVTVPVAMVGGLLQSQNEGPGLLRGLVEERLKLVVLDGAEQRVQVSPVPGPISAVQGAVAMAKATATAKVMATAAPTPSVPLDLGRGTTELRK